MVYLVTDNERLRQTAGFPVISVMESLVYLEPLKLIGFDTETGGLDCHKHKLLSMQFGCSDFQIVVDCLTVDPKNYKTLLESKDHCFLGWNLKFDGKFLLNHGIVPNNLYDGMLAEKLMYLGYPSGKHSMSLKAAGKTYLDIDMDKTIRGQIIWRGLTHDVIQYAADDVKYLEDIIRKQRLKLQELDLLKAVDMENKFLLPMTYMEWCGIHIDQDKWKAKMEKDNVRKACYLKACNEWLESFYEKHKGKETGTVFWDGKIVRFPYVTNAVQTDLFADVNCGTLRCCVNWNSVDQLIPLFKLLGVEVKVKDKESLDKKVLLAQKDKCELIPLYLNYKKAAKVTGTYGMTFMRQIDKNTGRIYTQFNQLGADTTRITSGGKDKTTKTEYINFLNLPSDAETRECFCAEPGNRWISIDYSGQETYLMASIADDKAIIKELTEGSGDIHSLTAYISYPEIPRDTPIKDIKKLYHDKRQDAKGIEFAINYGGDANTIATNKGIPLKEARAIYNNYMSGFSGLRRYQNFRRKDWFDKGYILLSPLTGHKAFIWDYDELDEVRRNMGDPDYKSQYAKLKQTDPDNPTVLAVREYYKSKGKYERSSINYPIQAAGSMCLRTALILFHQYLRDNDLLFKVKICVCPYDEVNVEAPDDIAEDVARKLYECMVTAGSYYCTRCKLDADMSRLSLCVKDYTQDGELLAEKGDAVLIGGNSFYNTTQNKKWDIKVKDTERHFDPDGPLPTFWIH